MWRFSLRAFSFLAVMLLAPAVFVTAAAAKCPRALRMATKLIVVSVPEISQFTATVETYERKRAGHRWRSTAPAVPAVIGSNGLGWGVGFHHLARSGEPVKQEGDKRSPLGIYAIGETFGHGPAAGEAELTLTPDQHVCVDDLVSPHYGKIVTRETAGAATKGEEMWAIPEYRRGAYVRYPADAKARGGSCIFIHVMSQSGQPTTGCVALAEADVARLQAWMRRGKTAIAFVSAGTRSRFGRCLPKTTTDPNDLKIKTPPQPVPRPVPQTASEPAEGALKR